MIHSWYTHDTLMIHSWYTHERSWDKRTRSSDLPNLEHCTTHVVFFQDFLFPGHKCLSCLREAGMPFSTPHTSLLTVAKTCLSQEFYNLHPRPKVKTLLSDNWWVTTIADDGRWIRTRVHSSSRQFGLGVEPLCRFTLWPIAVSVLYPRPRCRIAVGLLSLASLGSQTL